MHFGVITIKLIVLNLPLSHSEPVRPRTGNPAWLPLIVYMGNHSGLPQQINIPMSNYDPRKHHRRSIRLKGYDYAQEGLYFITICVQHRKHLFGNIENGKMILNDAGEMVVRWYDELENKYPDKLCHEMVVMPNHFHCIIENIRANDDLGDVGATLRGCPDGDLDAHAGTPLPQKYGRHNKKYNATIGDALDWFKTMTTDEYIRGVKNNGWQRFDGKMWQRNYWEHIIRNETSGERIAQYIINNPQKWDDDILNDGNKKLE